MDPESQRQSYTKLLSMRKSENVPRNHSTDETRNIFLLKMKLTDSQNSLVEYSTLKRPETPIIFEPLDEEGERYLHENMRLPPIDLTTTPTKYYINPHPTESIMSSSANSANEWWDKVDYSDKEDQELECAREGRKVRRIRKQTVREEVGQNHQLHQVGLMKKTFAKTLEMQKERHVRELQEEEANRAEIIAKLEKQMVSLYNLKRHYKRTLVGEGCTRGRTSLPLLAGASDNQLARQRDSLLARIKRKKLEEEKKREKQIERKINIVRTLLNEQKQREKECKRKMKEKDLEKLVKLKKSKAILDSTLFGEDEEISRDMGTTELEEGETKQIEEMTGDNTDSVEGVVGSPIPTEEITPAANDNQDLKTSEPSPRKSSKSKKKKKSSEASPKPKGKGDKQKKKKITAEAVEAPAICEPPAELEEASQMAELSLWFENWREEMKDKNRWIKEYENEQLPDESEITLKPPKIVFKDAVAGRRAHQVVAVTNLGLTALQCRVLGVQQTAGNVLPLQTSLSGPGKARTGQSFSLTVSLDAADGVEVEDGEATVLLLCCRGEVRTRLSVEVSVLTPRAEPALSTNVIRFRPQMFWRSGPFTKHLQISNSGALSCTVYWSEIITRVSPLAGSSIGYTIDVKQEHIENIRGATKEEFEEDEYGSDLNQCIMDILKTVFKNVFRKFRIDAHQPLIIPPKSQVSLPVRFIPALSEDWGDVHAQFRFEFEAENLENETQDLLVCGTIERSPFRLENEVVNMKLCYVGGTVQQGRLLVHSSARHACHVVMRVPRSLATVVSVVPRSTMVAAHSYVKLSVRLVLGWDFLDRPNRYLDASSGLLMFPVAVWVTDVGAPGAPPLEATVIASVAPPCPLTLTPPVLDLGTVSTMETVEATVYLRNHCPRTYEYVFLDLPENVMIEPGAGTGSILPLETIKLKLYFSPKAKDLGIDCERPGGEGEVNITLRCFTTISLASPVQRVDVRKEHLSKEDILHNSRISSKYTVSMPTSRISAKKCTRSESLPFSYDESEKSEGDRKVKFQEDTSKDGTRESFIYIPINDADENEEELDTEKDGNDYVCEEEYFSISEIKEEEDDLDTEDMWDFYSTFQFDKCLKEGQNGEEKERQAKDGQENEGTSLENALETVVEEKSMSSETDTTNQGRKAQPDTESTPSANFKDDETKEIASEPNEPNNLIKDIDSEKSFLVDEEGSIDENDLHESGSEEGSADGQHTKGVVQLPETSQRFATLSVKAQVVDPLVELSSQTVVLPPTPCTSYGIAHIYLRSRLQKACGIHGKITKFKTKFQFKSPSKQLVIEPDQGIIAYKQIKKISLIYSPVLNKKEIYDKALEIKVENLKWQKIQDMLNEYYKTKEKKEQRKKSQDVTSKKKSSKSGSDGKTEINDVKSKKDKGKKSKASVVSVKTKKTKESLKSSKLKKSSGPIPEITINPSEVEVSNEDLIEAEISLLKYFEAHNENLNVLCLLETDMGDGNKRREVLRCEVFCPVVAPSLHLGSPACLDFGPVAVGASARMEATVTNLSFFDAYVTLSTLNPVGPFMCPAHLEYPYWKDGELELPPEHILKIPILFRPTESVEVVEAFEVTSGATVLHLQARGRGVAPSFAFTPDREVFMVASAGGKKADLTITISNTCEAPLTFRFSQEFLKQGQSLPSPEPEEPSTAVASPKLKKGMKKDKKGKCLPEFTVFTEELLNCVENDFINVENSALTEPVFKIVNIGENLQVLAGENKQITMRFTLPADLNAVKGPKAAEGSIQEGAKKGPKKSEEKQATNETKSDKNVEKKKQSLSGKGAKKKKESLSVKSEKKDEGKTKRIFAAKFNVTFAGRTVKEWMFIGTKK